MFGTDISALSDLTFGLKRDRENLGEAIARRLQTPRGGLFYDPSYGLDIRAYLSSGMTQAVINEIASRAARECRKDARVLAAAVLVTPVGTRRLELKIELTTTSGTFDLVLAVGDVTVEVLSNGDAV